MTHTNRTDLEVAHPPVAQPVEHIMRLTLHELIEVLSEFEVEAAADEQGLRDALRIPRVERQT